MPKIMKQSGLLENQIIIDDALWPLIIRPLGYDSGIRSLERALETMARRVARMVVEGKLNKNSVMTINAGNIKQFLLI